MTFSISNGTDTITPWDRLGFDSTNAGASIVHRRLDGNVDVSLAPDSPRAGSLPLLFLDQASAEAARALLIQPGVWTASDPVSAVDGMRFVRSGDIATSQQDDRSLWLLTVGFQEVPA